MSRKEYPSQTFLNECFDYDPKTGLLYWKQQRPLNHFLNEGTCKKWHTCNAGNHAGRIIKENKNLSYKAVKLQGKSYYVHIIIWIMVYGYRPELIDHEDGDGLNNRLSNLRESNSKNNSRKKKVNNNTSGYTGVIVMDNGKFRADCGISLNGVHSSVNLGTYSDILHAAKIYATAALILTNENYSGVEAYDKNSEHYKFVQRKINDKFKKISNKR